MNDTAARLPLDGIRVLEIGAYIAGPYCGALLRSLGADVVKVEPPGGEPFRRGGGNRDPYFMQYNAGKRSLSVNLKAPAGLDLVKLLLPGFDVLLENNRPGTLDRLGLGPQVCAGINPGLVYASVSGFGDGGPLRDRPAYDSIGQSIGGHYSLMSDPGSERLAGGAAADLITATTATLSILAGLLGRERDPKRPGILVQSSLMEAFSALTVDAVTSFYENSVTPTRQSRHAQAQAYCVRTSDGAITLHMSVSDKFFGNICKAMAREDLTSDPRFAAYRDRLANYSELEAIFQDEFGKRDRATWEERLIAADVPHAPVLTIEEVVQHPQTEWLQMMEPERDGLALVRPPMRFDGQRPSRDFAVPQPGEHSREIAAEALGAAEIERLLKEGVMFEWQKAEIV